MHNCIHTPYQLLIKFCVCIIKFIKILSIYLKFSLHINTVMFKNKCTTTKNPILFSIQLLFYTLIAFIEVVY